jgi:hypothetical protein
MPFIALPANGDGIKKQRDTAHLWGARLTYRVLSSEVFSKHIEIQARI